MILGYARVSTMEQSLDRQLDALKLDTPQGKLMFTFMAGISQFERDLISERTREGLASARARGKVGGRKPKLDITKKKVIYELYQQKKTTVKDICSMFDISKPTLYKSIQEIGKTNSLKILQRF